MELQRRAVYSGAIRAKNAGIFRKMSNNVVRCDVGRTGISSASQSILADQQLDYIFRFRVAWGPRSNTFCLLKATADSVGL